MMINIILIGGMLLGLVVFAIAVTLQMGDENGSKNK